MTSSEPDKISILPFKLLTKSPSFNYNKTLIGVFSPIKKDKKDSNNIINSNVHTVSSSSSLSTQENISNNDTIYGDLDFLSDDMLFDTSMQSNFDDTNTIDNNNKNNDATSHSKKIEDNTKLNTDKEEEDINSDNLSSTLNMNKNDWCDNINNLIWKTKDATGSHLEKCIEENEYTKYLISKYVGTTDINQVLIVIESYLRWSLALYAGNITVDGFSGLLQTTACGDHAVLMLLLNIIKPISPYFKMTENARRNTYPFVEPGGIYDYHLRTMVDSEGKLQTAEDYIKYADYVESIKINKLDTEADLKSCTKKLEEQKRALLQNNGSQVPIIVPSYLLNNTKSQDISSSGESSDSTSNASNNNNKKNMNIKVEPIWTDYGQLDAMQTFQMFAKAIHMSVIYLNKIKSQKQHNILSLQQTYDTDNTIMQNKRQLKCFITGRIIEYDKDPVNIYILYRCDSPPRLFLTYSSLPSEIGKISGGINGDYGGNNNELLQQLHSHPSFVDLYKSNFIQMLFQNREKQQKWVSIAEIAKRASIQHHHPQSDLSQMNQISRFKKEEKEFKSNQENKMDIDLDQRLDINQNPMGMTTTTTGGIGSSGTLQNIDIDDINVMDNYTDDDLRFNGYEDDYEINSKDQSTNTIPQILNNSNNNKDSNNITKEENISNNNSNNKKRNNTIVESIEMDINSDSENDIEVIESPPPHPHPTKKLHKHSSKEKSSENHTKSKSKNEKKKKHKHKHHHHKKHKKSKDVIEIESKDSDDDGDDDSHHHNKKKESDNTQVKKSNNIPPISSSTASNGLKSLFGSKAADLKKKFEEKNQEKSNSSHKVRSIYESDEEDDEANGIDLVDEGPQKYNPLMDEYQADGFCVDDDEIEEISEDDNLDHPNEYVTSLSKLRKSSRKRKRTGTPKYISTGNSEDSEDDDYYNEAEEGKEEEDEEGDVEFIKASSTPTLKRIKFDQLDDVIILDTKHPQTANRMPIGSTMILGSPHATAVKLFLKSYFSAPQSMVKTSDPFLLERNKIVIQSWRSITPVNFSSPMTKIFEPCVTARKIKFEDAVMEFNMFLSLLILSTDKILNASKNNDGDNNNTQLSDEAKWFLSFKLKNNIIQADSSLFGFRFIDGSAIPLTTMISKLSKETKAHVTNPEKNKWLDPTLSAESIADMIQESAVLHYLLPLICELVPFDTPVTPAVSILSMYK